LEPVQALFELGKRGREREPHEALGPEGRAGDRRHQKLLEQELAEARAAASERLTAKPPIEEGADVEEGVEGPADLRAVHAGDLREAPLDEAAALVEGLAHRLHRFEASAEGGDRRL